MPVFTKKELLSVILETKKRRFVPVEQKKEKVIQNALANYAKGCKREEIVAIYDTTIIGNGKQGFLLATDGLYGDQFEKFKRHTSGVNKIPFENLQKYYRLDQSSIAKEKENAIGDNLYRAIYSDGESLIVYNSSVYAEEVLPVMEGILTLLNVQESEETVEPAKSVEEEVAYTREDFEDTQEEIRRKQEELKAQMDALLRQQEVLNRQEKELQREEERKKEEIRLAEEKRQAEEAKLAEEKRLAEEARIAEERKNIKESSYNVCFLGDDGVGKRTLIHAIVDFAKQNNETVFLESNELCRFVWKGENITLLPMSSSKLKTCKVDGELFYLVVDVTEGAPYELQDIIQSRTDVSFDGIIYNKCDCAMDEELIELVEIETMSLFEDNNYEKEIKGYKLAALGGYDYNEVFEEILDDIVGEKQTSSNTVEKLISEADSLYTKSSFVQALQIYEKCALEGNGKAQYMCSQMYQNGRGTEVNWEKAKEYMRQSIASGYANPADMLSINFAKDMKKSREERSRQALIDEMLKRM